MRNLYKNEKRHVGMTVSRRPATPFTISGATYEVRDTTHAVVETGTAYVDEVNVMFLLDTAQAVYEVGKTYWCYFAVEITHMAKLLKGRVAVRVAR